MTRIKLLNDGDYGGLEHIQFPVEVAATEWENGFSVSGNEIIRIGGKRDDWYEQGIYYFYHHQASLVAAYAYEVTTNRGTKYLVLADSVAYENAVLFGYQLKPLYEGE